MFKKILLFLILFGLLIGGFVLARKLEEPLPPVPGEEAPTTTETTLGAYISYVFRFILMLGGIIAFAALIYGGFSYLTSAGNPVKMTSAKRQMFAAIIGLILLLSSYLILKTINPALVGITPEELKPDQGVCFYDSEEKRVCYTESKRQMPEDFEAESVEFESPKGQLKGLYPYSQENWRGYWGKIENDCGSPPCKKSLGTTLKSFYLDWNKPGLYLYEKTGLEVPNSGKPYNLYQSSANDLGDYNDKVKSLRLQPMGALIFAGGCYPRISYGAVLHTEGDFEGMCRVILPFGEPVFGAMPGTFDWCKPWEIENLNSCTDCKVKNDTVSSVTVFSYEYLGARAGKVTFYEAINHKGDRFTVEAGDIEKYWEKGFDYPIEDGQLGVEIEKGERAIDNKKMENILSFDIEGNYLVILGQDKIDKPAWGEFRPFCEVFRESDPDLKGNYVRPTNTKINSIAIIPLAAPLEE